LKNQNEYDEYVKVVSSGGIEPMSFEDWLEERKESSMKI